MHTLLPRSHINLKMYFIIHKVLYETNWEASIKANQTVTFGGTLVLPVILESLLFCNSL
jgi:hypothetical protein